MCINSSTTRIHSYFGPIGLPAFVDSFINEPSRRHRTYAGATADHRHFCKLIAHVLVREIKIKMPALELHFLLSQQFFQIFQFSEIKSFYVCKLSLIPLRLVASGHRRNYINFDNVSLPCEQIRSTPFAKPLLPALILMLLIDVVECC